MHPIHQERLNYLKGKGKLTKPEKTELDQLRELAGEITAEQRIVKKIKV